MRIAAIEVSHWHSLYDAAYLRVLSALPDVELVGVHDPDAAVAAGVLECPDAQVVGSEDDDRLVEELVLDDVVRGRDLLEAARHLPDPRPQQLGLHRVELRI